MIKRRVERLSAIAWALLFGVSALVAALIPYHVVDINQPSNVGVQPIANPVAQTFVAPSNHLSSFGFFFVDERTGGPEILIRFLLVDMSGATVRTDEREVGRDLRVPSDIFRPTYFNFPEVEHSKSKSFHAVIEGGSPTGIGVFRSKGNVYGSGVAVVENTVTDFDFSFALRHRGTVGEAVVRLSRTSPTWIAAALIVMLAAMMGAAGVLAGRVAAPVGSQK